MLSYLRVLRTPQVPLPLAAGLLGALLIGTMPLAVLLFVQQRTGSFAQAGAVVGVLTAGNAAGVVLQGAAIDRYGPRLVLVVTSVVCCTSLLLLVRTGSGWCAGLAGATLPATPSSLRAAWPVLIQDRVLRTSAYALHAVVFTAGGVTGPLLVTALHDPALAVVVAAVLAGTSGLLFVASTAATRIGRGPCVRWAPTPGLRTLVVTNGCAGVGVGVVTVAVPAALSAHDRLGLIGLAFAANACGDLAGGLAYGATRWSAGLPRRLTIAFVAMAFGMAGLALSAGVPGLLVAAMLLAGLVAPLAGITSSALLDDVAPPGAVTASYASLVAGGLAGSAVGATLAGHLTGRPAVVLAATAVLLLGQAVVVRVRRRTLTPAGG